MRVSARNHKKDSVDIINLVGYQHSFLTGTLEQITFCYSLQVGFFQLTYLILSIKYLCINDLLDDD